MNNKLFITILVVCALHIELMCTDPYPQSAVASPRSQINHLHQELRVAHQELRDAKRDTEALRAFYQEVGGHVTPADILQMEIAETHEKILGFSIEALRLDLRAHQLFGERRYLFMRAAQIKRDNGVRMQAVLQELLDQRELLEGSN